MAYVKITFEDVKIAENFFENDKHLDEFLSQVCRYYIGFETTFKYKNVKKYFETYKKTMDRVIIGRSTGSIGGKKRIENQQDTRDTLEGVLEGGVEIPLQPKERKERKVKKESETEFTQPIVSDFISYFEENGYNVMLAKKAFNYYNDNGWKDSQGVQVKNWKGKVRNNWFKDEGKLKLKVLWVEVLLNHTYKDMIKSEYLKAVKEGYINCDNPVITKEYYK